MEKKTNKAKLEMFKFLRKSVLSQGIFTFDKIGGKYALPANSIIICLLGYFWKRRHAEFLRKSYMRRKCQFKFLQFS